MRKEPVCSGQDLHDKPSDRTDDKDRVTRTIAKRGKCRLRNNRGTTNRGEDH